MASSGLWSSRIPATLTCQCRTTDLKGFPGTPCCSHRAWQVQASCRPRLAAIVCNCGHSSQQHSCNTAAAGFSSSSSSNSVRSKAGYSSNKHNSHTAEVYGTATSALGLQQLSGAVIMKQLKAATSWQQLQQLVEQHGQQLNQRHSSALITHLAQLTPQQFLLQEVECPLSHSQQQGPQAQNEQYQEGQQQQPEQPGLEFEPLIDLQQIAAAGWPPASSRSAGSSGGSSGGLQLFLRRLVAPLVDAHLQQYDARGLANVLWALARLQPLLQAAACGPYPSRRWLDSYCSISQPVLQQFDAQQLSNTLWALVKLQHYPPDSWLGEWYAAFAQQAGFGSSRGSSGSGHSSGLQLQSLSSALWSLAHLQVSSSSCVRPPGDWVDSLLRQAALQLQLAAGSVRDSGSGQAVSNLLWSCVQLRQQPPRGLLQAVQEHACAAAAAVDTTHAQVLSDQALSNMMWSLARLHTQQQSCSSDAGTAAAEHQDEQRRLSSRQCSTFGRDSNAHSADSGRQANSSGSSPSTLLQACADVLLSASTRRSGVMSWRHLATISWAAGMLQLNPHRHWALQLQQRLQQPDASGLHEQELSLLLWGLSQFNTLHQQQQPNSKSSQQQHGSVLDPKMLQQLLEAQQGKLAGYSSLALHSSLLSLGRLGFSPSEPLLQAWLKEVARRNYLTGAGGQAMVDVCCGLALVRRNQRMSDSATASSSSSSVGSSWGVGSSAVGRLGFSQCRDADWLTGFCGASASRLSACTGDQLSGIGWALASLGFRAPMPWVLAWQAAVSEASGSISAAAAARTLWALKHLSASTSGTSRGTTATQLVGALAAAAATGRCDVHSLAVAADCIADIHKSSQGSSSSSRASLMDGTGGAASESSRSVSSTSMQQLLWSLSSRIHSCDSQQLLMVLSAAATTGTQLPQGLLAAAVQRAQLLARQHQLQNRSIAGMMVAVARLQAAAGQQQQQQQQQQVARRHMSKWVTCMLRAFAADKATTTELVMVLWSLALLDYTPGPAWLNQQWLKHSQQLLPRFTPAQLASVGWSLTVLNHRPSHSWCQAWVQSAGVQAAAAAPSQLALLLYAAATLGCQVDRAWLLSAAASAANSMRRWSVRDLSLGLWGLAQLGLRAVADGELLEVLFSHLTSGHITVAMQGLSPHQLLQLLQAAALLRPPTAAGSVAALTLGADEYWLQGRAPQQPFSKTAVRKLKWAAKATAQRADAAAATAVAAAQRHQQLLAVQTSGTESSREIAAAAATAQEAAAAWSAATSAAAAAGAALVAATSGRSPDLVGMPVEPAWVLAWCKAAAQQMHKWSPGIAAAALSALAVLGVQPPLAWQQQLLQQVWQRRQHMTRQNVSTISSALELFKSPLGQQWLQQLHITYTPAAAAAHNSPACWAVQKQGCLLTNAERKQRWQQLWLQHKRRQKSQLQGSSRVSSHQAQWTGQAARSGVRYPQHFTGQSLLQLRRQHRSVRLVGWWRRQQQLMHQHRQQQLLQHQRKGVIAAEAGSSDWKPGSQYRWGQPGHFVSSSSSSHSISRRSSSPVSSTYPVGAVAPKVGPPLQGRRLSGNGSVGGVQLAQKPVLRQPHSAVLNGHVPAGTADGSKSDRGTRLSAGTDAAAVNDSTAAGGVDATAAVNARADDPPAAAAAAYGSRRSDTCSSPMVVAGSGCDGSSATAAVDSGAFYAVLVGADAGVVQAVWESLNGGKGACSADSSSPVILDHIDAARSVQFVGVHVPYNQHTGGLQHCLSWACQST